MRVRNILVALAIIAPALAIADDQINGVGAEYWSRRQSVSTTTACITVAQGATICALFPAGTSWDFKNRLTVVTTDAAVRCCWAGEGALAISSELQVTDATSDYGTGQGACFSLESAGQEYHGRPDRIAQFRGQTAGTRRGLCTTAFSGINGSKEDANGPDGGGIYFPCGDASGDNDADADCADIDPGGATVPAGVCNEDTIKTGDPTLRNDITGVQEKRAGMYLNCVCASGTCNVTVRKELVQR